MGFEEASKKYSRLILLVFASVITAFVYIAPGFLLSENAQLVIESRSEWMILYMAIIVFYFKEKEA